MTKQPTDNLVTPALSRRRWLRATIPIVVILLILTLVASHLRHRTSSPGQAAAAGSGPAGAVPAALPVTVQPAATSDLNVYLDALGTVAPLANVTLRAQISGQLVEVDFKEGQMVKQGDLLALIDPRPYEVAFKQVHGQLVQMQAQLKSAQMDLARYDTLAKQDSISTQQVDTQRALVTQYQGQVETAEAAVAGAQLNLTYCRVTAPVSGRVGFRQVDPGNYVTAGDAAGLVVLTQVTPITVIFTLPEDSIPDVSARLRAGAVIPVDAYDRTQIRKLASGTLSTIDNLVDATTGTFKLRALFANGDGSLFPNQFVNVRMLLDVHRGATVVPTSAIERGQPGTYVYVVKPDHTVAARPVALGAVEGERVEVLSGLAAGEPVVVDGADKLKEGMAITVQEPAASPAADSSAPGSRQ